MNKKKSIKQKILILYWFLFVERERPIDMKNKQKVQANALRIQDIENRAATTPIPD